MTKTYCNICGKELGRYEEWRVNVSFSNDPRPPIEPRHSGIICEGCALPAIEIVSDGASGNVSQPDRVEA